jgi:hypothetical protein
MRELDMQTYAFRGVFYLASVGCVIHHLLPFRLRLPFFVILSIGAMSLVLGMSYEQFWDGAIAYPRVAGILVIGAILIGMCHLPIGFWKRVGLLVVVGGLVAFFRTGAFIGLRLAAVWPVLAAIFMFRLIIYLVVSL